MLRTMIFGPLLLQLALGVTTAWWETGVASADEGRPVRIADPVGGHIHPAVCVTANGTLVVTYGTVRQ